MVIYSSDKLKSLIITDFKKDDYFLLNNI